MVWISELKLTKLCLKKYFLREALEGQNKSSHSECCILWIYIMKYRTFEVKSEVDLNNVGTYEFTDY